MKFLKNSPLWRGVGEADGVVVRTGVESSQISPPVEVWQFAPMAQIDGGRVPSQLQYFSAMWIASHFEN
jgi:hypothetical protein